jgi:hypothetical protein
MINARLGERQIKTTYPLVISTPIHVGSKTKYKALKFGFRYHGTVSWAAKRLTIASAPEAKFFAVGVDSSVAMLEGDGGIDSNRTSTQC